MLDFARMTADLVGPLDKLDDIRASVKREYDQTKAMLEASGGQGGEVAIKCMEFRGQVGESSLEVEKLGKEVEDIVAKHKVTPERKLAMTIRYEN